MYIYEHFCKEFQLKKKKKNVKYFFKLYAHEIYGLKVPSNLLNQYENRASGVFRDVYFANRKFMSENAEARLTNSLLF